MQTIAIHRETVPQRTIRQIVRILQEKEYEAVLAYPTDTGYAFGCALGARHALRRIQQLKGLTEKYPWTLLCTEPGCLGTYARISTPIFRQIKRLIPGPYTFILQATSEVPRQLQQKKRRTIGIRISDHPVVVGLVQALGTPLVSTSARVEESGETPEDPATLGAYCGHALDLLLDAGVHIPIPSTIIDATGEEPVILRRGAGDLSPFEQA